MLPEVPDPTLPSPGLQAPLTRLPGVLGDKRNEERAVVDLVPDLLIPRVPDPQLALVE